MEALLNIQIRVIKAQAEASIKQFQSQWNAMQRSMNSGGGAAAGIAGGAAATEKGVRNLTGSLRSAGYALTATFTAPIVAAGKQLLDFTLQNQTAFAELQKVYGSDPLNTKQYIPELNQLQKLFAALSGEYGVNQAEVIQVGAAWAQAGVQGNELGKAVETTLKAMVIGGLNAGDATDALIAIQAQYGASSGDLVDILNTLNAVENQTGISMEGLIQGFARSAGSAAEAGIDYRHLAAFLAALTPAAGTAAQAGNALKTIISRMLAPTSDANDIFKKLGINIADTSWKSATATDRIIRMADAFHGLDQAQKDTVSAYIASRFQVNRFDILMRDVYNGTHAAAGGLSYYRTALEATKNESTVATIANNELMTVLNSQPHQLKQVGVIIQNQLTKAFQQLIPVILYFAGLLAKAATWFAGLDPHLQKFIGLALLLTAALGPLLLYISAMRFALAGLPGMVMALFNPFGKLIGGVGELVGMLAGGGVKAISAFGSVFEGLGGVLAKAGGSIASGAGKLFEPVLIAARGSGAALGYVFSSTWATIGKLFSYGSEMIVTTFSQTLELVLMGARTFSGAFGRAFSLTFQFIPMLFSSMFGVFSGGLKTLAGVAGAGFKEVVITALMALGRLPGLAFEAIAGLGPMLLRIGPLVLRALTGPIGLAVTAVATLLYAFRNQIANAWTAVIKWFQSGASGLGNAMSGIVGIFNNAVGYVIGAFNQLPAGVRNALLAVVHIVESAALAVYKLFSYLNPFAHHSPSLVENVTLGMAEVAKQFATVTNISGPIDKAYQDIKQFGTAIANLAQNSAKLDMAKGLSDLTAAGATPATLQMYKTLSGDLADLKAKQDAMNSTISTQQQVVNADKVALDAATDALDRQQKTLDALTKTQSYYENLLNAAKDAVSKYADTSITGERAMSDAIFANTQAQKQLQLQMMNMEDVTGPIEDVKSKLSDLAGEIETLSGTREALRQAGAGSDILKTYDDQIAALKDQQTATKGAAQQYDDLQAALDKLQRAGQKLDLENSLNFDGLHRQIEQAAVALNELPFDKIMAGLKASQKDVDKYSAAYDNATAAVKAQQAVVDSATASRDALQGTYDAESKKLQALTDAYSAVGDAINKVNDALQTMSDNAQKASDAKKAAAGGGGAGGEGAAATNFDAAAGGDFPSGNLGQGLGTSTATDELAKMTQQAVDNTRKAFGNLSLVKPLQAKWAEVTKWWKSNVSPGLAQFGSGIAEAFGHLDLSGGLSNVINSSFVKDLVKTAKTVGKFAASLVDLFKPEVAKFISDLSGYIKELANRVLPKVLPLLKALGGLFDLLWQVAKPLIGILAIGLIVAIKLLSAAFVNILGPVLKVAADLLGDFIQVLTGVINFVVDVFTGQWGKAWGDIVQILKGTFQAIWDVIKGAWSLVVGVFTGMINAIVDVAKWLYDELVGHSIFPDLIDAIVNLFLNLPGQVINAVWSLVKLVASWAYNVMMTALSWLGAGWASLIAWVVKLPGNFIANIIALLGLIASFGLNVMSTLLRYLGNGWRALTGWVASLPGSFVGAIGGIVGRAAIIGSSVFSSMLGAMGTGWSAVYRWLTGIAASFLAAMGNIIGAATSLGSNIFTSLWNGIKSGAGTFGDLASMVGHAILRLIDDIIPHTITIPGISILGHGVGPWTETVIPHFGAKGGIFDKATNMIIGEAGREVLIPLTNPQRAWDLVQQSGLLNVVGNYMNTGMQKNNSSMLAAKLNGMSARGTMTSGGVTNNVRTEQHVHFEGSTLEFPNVKNASDAEDFIRNLQHLSGGNV